MNLPVRLALVPVLLSLPANPAAVRGQDKRAAQQHYQRAIASLEKSNLSQV